MAEGIVFDTSVYIRGLRQGNAAVLDLRRAGKSAEKKIFPLYLSAVVLEELYVGASSGKARKALERLEKDFTKIKRLLVPNQNDWAIAGQVLNSIGEKYGFNQVAKARLTNDTLIAMGVARNGFTLQTVNAKDFAMIAQFRPFRWEVI